MKKTLLVVCSLVLSTVLFGQKIGQWDTHFSYEKDIEQLVQGDGIVYALTDGKLYSYNQTDNSLEIYVKKKGGNNNIKLIAYSDKHKALIAIRDNSDIDLIYSNGAFTNIPDLKNTEQNLDKAVNSVYVDGDYAYLSTNFGLLVLNLDKEEVKETVLFNIKFTSSCIYNDSIYATTQNGVLRVNAKSNILDVNTWEQFKVREKYPHSDYDFTDSQLTHVFVFKDKLHFFLPREGICYFETPDLVNIALKLLQPQKVEYINNDRLLITKPGLLWEMQEINSAKSITAKGLTAIIPNGNKINQYWAGVTKQSLSLVEIEGETFKPVFDQKKPEGPLSNNAFFMRHQAGQLLIAGGGYTGNRQDRPAQLSQYENGKWVLYSKEDIDAKTGGDARDFTSVITDPLDPKHKFVTSWGEGLYEFQDKTLKTLHTPENTNGVLQDIFGRTGFVRLNGMSFDKFGNLWVMNSMVSAPIKVLQKNGTWAQIYHSELAENTKTNAWGVMIDRFNRKWFSTIYVDAYLFILDDNNTISNPIDDKKKYVRNFIDQDGKTLAVRAIYATVEDKNGNVWVATNVGIFVVYNSSNLLQKDIVFNKIKIPRTDGTNNADILLENVEIKAAAVDGANRKWFGTGSGAYLISGNGMETLHHFTMDNSPLPSNDIISIAIDPETGVVYLGTDKGVVSFVGEATEGKEEYNDVHAFPNPVRPGYEGAITVTGLQADSNVKITDVRGNLLNQGVSLGGQYIWNGRNGSGKRVDTGVYLVFASTADGKSGVVTKIMVVN